MIVVDRLDTFIDMGGHVVLMAGLITLHVLEGRGKQI